MSIQEVSGNGKMPEFHNKKKSGQAEGFQESLIENLKSHGPRSTEGIGSSKSAGKLQGMHRAESSGVGVVGGRNGVRVSAVEMTEAMRAAEVKHMSYEESDNVKIAIMEGYALKGKVLPRQNYDNDVICDISVDKNDGDAEPVGDNSKTMQQVYVEAKYEDGRVEAFWVDTSKVAQKTEHSIEKFALETVSGI